MPQDAKHIALFIYGLTGGGATRRTLTLAQGFAERGHRVDLVVVSPEGPLANALPAGVRRVVLDSIPIRMAGWRRRGARRRRIQASAIALARYLRRERPDVLMSAANHVHMTALFARRLSHSGVPLVLRVSNHLTESLQRGAKRRPSTRLRLARRAYGWADAAIPVSHGIAVDLAKHTTLAAERIVAIGNPSFTPRLVESAGAPLPHPWLAPGAPPVLLAAGRLAPAKDLATLVRAFARIRARRPARLIILGEGKQRGRIEALLRALELSDDVALPGFVENPFAWMSRAAVFVLSSAWEGSPGVLVEALACGCPVVSTDCPSGPAEILDGGAYGRLVKVGDEAGLADAIEATLDSSPDREKLKMRAREFDVDRAVELYLQVLLSVRRSRA